MNTTKNSIGICLFKRRIRTYSKTTKQSNSTGGTEDFIKNLGIPVIPVEDVTSTLYSGW
jgi:AICAR transformylase/IMP cyclohydrolase PurH